MTPSTDTWDPAQYKKFEAERRQPFVDLVAMCTPVPGGSVVDLGCGGGERTVELHELLQAAQTLGVDNSEAMLAGARVLAGPGLRFVLGDLAGYDGPAVDVVFANASLHWIDDQPALLERLRQSVLPGGQLAFQVPYNFDHASHTVARTLATEAPFVDALAEAETAWRPGDPALAPITPAVLTPWAYAETLHALEATDQSVVLRVYGHLLESSAAVAEWTKGTLLTAYRQQLNPELFEQFFERYRRRLLDALGDQRPYFYAFPRINCWARF